MKKYNWLKNNPELLSTADIEKLRFAIETTKAFLKALSDAQEEPLVIYMSKRRK